MAKLLWEVNFFAVKYTMDCVNRRLTKWTIKLMVKEIQKYGIPASISNSAGTFVCNHVMYGLLYLIDRKYPNLYGGFIHVPFIPEQVVNKKICHQWHFVI